MKYDLAFPSSINFAFTNVPSLENIYASRRPYLSIFSISNSSLIVLPSSIFLFAVLASSLKNWAGILSDATSGASIPRNLILRNAQGLHRRQPAARSADRAGDFPGDRGFSALFLY